MEIPNLIQPTEMVLIEEGGYGEIYKAKVKSKTVIVKKQKEAHYLCLEGFQREVFVLKTLFKKPHIAELYDFYWEDKLAHLVLKYYELGDLSHYINVNGGFSIQDAKHLMQQLLIGLNAMHSLRIAHCDLKAENILLCHKEGKLHAVLADFGCSIYCTTKFVSGTLGSPSYLAPEQLLGKAHSPFLSDMFGIGVIFYEMLFGENPFFDPNFDLKQISLKTLHFISNDVPIKDAAAKSFFIKLVEPNPKKRLNIRSAQKHPFITGKSDAKRTMKDWFLFLKKESLVQ